MIELYKGAIQEVQNELLAKGKILKVLRDESKLIKDKIELNRLYPEEYGY
jgi:hypothetical protein